MQLEIYGSEYEIQSLDAGTFYFVRVFAKNQVVGWGDPSSTVPLSMIPRSAPEVGWCWVLRFTHFCNVAFKGLFDLEASLQLICKAQYSK